MDIRTADSKVQGLYIIIIRVFCPKADPSLQAQEPRLQFCPKAGLPLQTQEPRLPVAFCGQYNTFSCYFKEMELEDIRGLVLFF